MSLQIVNFAAGNPLLPFEYAAKSALSISPEQLRLYPGYYHEEQQEWLAGVPAFLEQQGLQVPGHEHDIKTACFSNGAAGGLQMVLSSLQRKFKSLNTIRRNKRLHTLTPVVLTPVPTYGMFLDRITAHGFSLEKISRDPGNNWALSPEQVGLKLEELRSKNCFAVAYFDSNPGQPHGLVRGASERDELAKVFLAHNAQMQQEDMKVGCGVYDEPIRSKLSKLTHQMATIDDMVYLGLQFGEEKPASFISDPQLSNQAYVLLSASKIGMPGFRAGLVIAHPRHYSIMFNHYRQHNDFPPTSSIAAARTIFSADPHNQFARSSHLNQLNEFHQYGRKLMMTLIQGEVACAYDKADQIRIRKDLADVMTDCRERDKWLRTGIPEIEISSAPEAGFFQLLGFQKLRGRKLPNNAIYGKHRGRSIDDSRILQTLLYAEGAIFIRGVACGLSEEDLYMRASFGITPREIITGLANVRRAIGALGT